MCYKLIKKSRSFLCLMQDPDGSATGLVITITNQLEIQSLAL